MLRRRPSGKAVFLLAFLLLVPALAIGQEDRSYGEGASRLILNVYLDSAGRSLINGYADDPGALSFINSSEYDYQEDTRQLYAVTSALTSKSRDDWSLNLQSGGSFSEYHVVFYLPEESKVSLIKCSPGLAYQVYAANESLVADVQGLDVQSPEISIGYSLPLALSARAGEGTRYPYLYPYLAAALLVTLAAGTALAVLRRRSAPGKPEKGSSTQVIPQAPSPQNFHPASSLSLAEGQEETPDPLEIADHTGKADMTWKMAAVMDTLTDREKAVVEALMKHGGRMTQAEIRYETDISKSSLSGILTNLERRKIITKKEMGRTNAIEISERLSNGEKPS